jgi:nucleoside-diphosphate-sugar epimerase
MIRAMLKGAPFRGFGEKWIRDYLYVSDVAEAFLTLAEGAAPGAYNICSGEPVRMGELAGAIVRITGTDNGYDLGGSPPRQSAAESICGDNARLRALGWQPRVPLDEGLARTVEWWERKLLESANSTAR